APTEVAVHPLGDRRVVRSSRRIEQRDRGECLAGLAIAALHDIFVVPRMPHCVADGPRDTLDRGDLLADGPTGGRLAGLLVLAVDQDGAGGTESGPAAELGPVQAEHV